MYLQQHDCACIPGGQGGGRRQCTRPVTFVPWKAGQIALLGYLERPEPLVGQLCRCAAPGGVVSTMAGNARAMAVLDPGNAPQVAAMAAVELEASRRDPCRQLSRVFHLVGRKEPG